MSITLFTPATGFPDLEVKIAYGLARVGIEAFGLDKVIIQKDNGFYKIVIDADESKFIIYDKTFKMLCARLLSSDYIPFSTPGISGRSAKSISFKEKEDFSLNIFKSIYFLLDNKKNENLCRHKGVSVGNIIGLSVSTSFHNKRDGLDFQLQYKNPKDKGSPKLPRRPTNPKSICKICGLLSLIGVWFGSFIFNIINKNYKIIQEIVVIPIPNKGINGSKLQEIFSLQHQIRKAFLPELPQTLYPLVFLSKIPSSADILKDFDLFVAVLSHQQGYHVDGLFLIPIKNYLDFIRKTPFNIATIEKMLASEAKSSLQELNNAIFNNNLPSLLKFARLYVQETSTINFTNLLYPETAKYLLKEVAMIKQEIIENTSIGSLARTLRYFIREKKYGYADDIRNARKDSKGFEETIAKMLREGRLRLEQKEHIHLPTDEEIKEIFKIANEDFEATKTALVILAFSFSKREEIKEEPAEEIESEE